MNEELRLLDILEILGLIEKGAKISDVGLDALILEVDVQGETVRIAVAACQEHDAGESHLNYFLLQDSVDAGAA